jgi:hypothetical protein
MTGWGCETSTAGLSWQPGEAGSSLSREAPVRVGSSSDNAGTRWHCQTARVRLARREGVREEPVCKAPQSTHQLQPGGCGLGCGAHRPAKAGGRELLAGVDSLRVEATVKAHGVVVAMPLGQSWTPTPSTGRAVNVGTVRCRPRRAQPAHERAGALSAVGTGRGGGSVVVAGVTTRHGGRESRQQGEGSQQVSSRSKGRPGGRR